MTGLDGLIIWGIDDDDDDDDVIRLSFDKDAWIIGLRERDETMMFSETERVRKNNFNIVNIIVSKLLTGRGGKKRLKHFTVPRPNVVSSDVSFHSSLEKMEW